MDATSAAALPLPSSKQEHLEEEKLGVWKRTFAPLRPQPTAANQTTGTAGSQPAGAKRVDTSHVTDARGALLESEA